MFRLLVAFIGSILVLGSSYAKQIAPERLRSCLEVPFTLSLGFNFTSLFAPERVPANPQGEIRRLERQLTGDPTDAPLHYRIGDIYRLLDCDVFGSAARYQKQRNEHYQKAAEQYKCLLEKDPSDASLVVGYARSVRHSMPDGPFPGIGALFLPPGADEKSQEIEGMLRKVIEADPAAWEARLELADHLEARALTGAMAGRMFAQMSEETRAAVGATLLKPLTLEEAEKLLKEAADQRDLAVKYAPRQSGAYAGRFRGRLDAGFTRYMVLDGVLGDEDKRDKAAAMRLVKEVVNPADLRKAWQLDPENATVLRALMFFEIADVLLDESSRRPFKELGNNILNQDPAKRTWNLISGPNRVRLGRYEGRIREVIKKHPFDVWAAYEALGLLKAFQGERKQAETAFTVAARLSDRASLSCAALFLARVENVPPDSSASARAQAVIPVWEMRLRVSGSPSDMINLAGAYAEVGRLDRAEGLARRALREDSENFLAHHLLGVVLLKRQGDSQEAIGHLEKAVALSKEGEYEYETEEARLNLGIAYAIAGDTDKAIEALKKVGGQGTPHNQAARVLKEMEVGSGHVIYCSTTELVRIDPTGVMDKYQQRNGVGVSTPLTTFTAEVGSIVITQPDGYLTVLPPESRLDAPDTPAAEYEPGRIAVKHPDGKTVCPEGSTMEILTAPRTFGQPK